MNQGRRVKRRMQRRLAARDRDVREPPANLHSAISRLPAAVRGALILALVGVFASVAGCTALARHEAAGRTSNSPAVPWSPPRKAVPPLDTTEHTLNIPRELLESSHGWTLEDIVALALQNNPATRATWETARAASAKVGSDRGVLLPQVNGAMNYTKSKSAFSQQFVPVQKTYQPSLTLQFILFDFGKTRADLEESKQKLYSANWSHNAMIQTVMLQVETAYYQYLYAKAMRAADSAALEEARMNLDAAEERHRAGLATVADVLQAKSNLAQRQLDLQAIEGQIQTVRGSLATAMGLSPTIDYDIGFLPSSIPTEEVTQTVEELLRNALVQWSDLAAARATALAARAHAKSVRRDRLPAITLQGNIARRYYDNPDKYTDPYSEGIYLNVPLFTGFSKSYDAVEAQAKAEAAMQDYELLKRKVDLDVWSSYFNLKTANERLVTAEDFLKSATELHDVALGRYRSGVGSILDLTAAQTALEEARAQSVNARTDWFLSLAGLAYATGRLALPEATNIPSTPAGPGEDSQP